MIGILFGRQSTCSYYGQSYLVLKLYLRIWDWLKENAELNSNTLKPRGLSRPNVELDQFEESEKAMVQIKKRAALGVNGSRSWIMRAKLDQGDYGNSTKVITNSYADSGEIGPLSQNVIVSDVENGRRCASLFL